jgi:Xaa-Pro dipeptidase
MMKPGVHWDTIHLHGHKVLIEGFIDLGIFRSPSHLSDSGEDNGNVDGSLSPSTPQAQDRSALAEAVLQSGITAAFFPHGLGHSLGLDVHDSRQYLKSTLLDLPPSTENTPAKLYAYLRIRQPLLENMVLTVEPGCYFPQQLMQLHGVWESEYVDQEVLRRYVGVGGVRIEDAVLVTGEGSENLTKVPRERAEVEALCSGTA